MEPRAAHGLGPPAQVHGGWQVASPHPCLQNQGVKSIRAGWTRLCHPSPGALPPSDTGISSLLTIMPFYPAYPLPFLGLRPASSPRIHQAPRGQAMSSPEEPPACKQGSPHSCLLSDSPCQAMCRRLTSIPHWSDKNLIRLPYLTYTSLPADKLHTLPQAEV